MLAGVDLTLAAGETARLAGANGSGKTSLLRILAGVAEPSAGALRRPPAWAFVPEKVVLAPALRCREWLAAMRALRGLGAADWAAAVSASGLEPAVLGAPSATLSKGMLQRIALLEAVHADCPLLLLDEPFAGLDEPGRQWLADELAARTAAGAAVLLTDHSGASERWSRLDRRLRLADGRCGPDAVPDVATVTVRATHPDGRRSESAVPAEEVDDLLRGLLAGGWHIERVGE